MFNAASPQWKLFLCGLYSGESNMPKSLYFLTMFSAASHSESYFWAAYTRGPEMHNITLLVIYNHLIISASESKAC